MQRKDEIEKQLVRCDPNLGPVISLASSAGQLTFRKS